MTPDPAPPFSPGPPGRAFGAHSTPQPPRASLRAMLLLLAAALILPPLVSRAWNRAPALGSLPDVSRTGSRFERSPGLSFSRTAIGPDFTGLPRITNVQILDLDGDSRPEIVVCDGQRNAVFSYALVDGQWRERTLAADIPAPAHVAAADLDGDGDLDLLVAVLGHLEPHDGLVGRVMWLENIGDGYVPHVILDGVRRVADVQPGDFDGDGDIDLAVAGFGYSRGQVLWLENLGDGRFAEHELLSAPGAIHVPVADFDGDGDLDIAAIVTQDEEEIWAFENLGGGAFRPRLLQQWANFDLGGAGLIAADLDGDGDMDLIAPVGDNLEDLDPFPQPYHGCFWLENVGGWEFRTRRIATFGGAYAAAVADLNQDGHQDVVLVSMANDFRQTGNAGIIWLENDGRQQFTPWMIDADPIHLVTVACGDIDGDGRPDIVAGGLNMRPPYERIGRISAWLSGGKP